MNFLTHSSRKPGSRPEPEFDLGPESDLKQLKYHTKPAGPRDWKPDHYVESDDGGRELLKDGDIVSWTGKSKNIREKVKHDDGSRSYTNLEKREVITENGLVGWVWYWGYNPSSGEGFEQLSEARVSSESMKPSQLASQLRRIASKIDASSNPDRALVARDLKKILAAVGPAYSGYSESQIVNEIIRSVNHLKGSDDLLSTANDFIIRLDDQTNTISAILNEADPSGNVSEIKIEFELVRKGPVIKTLV
jgi:hypothetical protein